MLPLEKIQVSLHILLASVSIIISFKNYLNDFRKLNPERLAELGVTILPGYEDMSLKRYYHILSNVVPVFRI